MAQAQQAALTPGAGPQWMEYTPRNRMTIMVALMLGVLMQMIDSSIVNVAVPTMQGNLGVTLDQISWVATGYILANVITLPLTGWLSGVFGRRLFLAGSMALFTLASLGCGMSGNLPLLIFFRILQGIGGAALIATAQATMMEIFPPQQLGMVQAVFGIGVMVGPSIGPTLGGWITDNFNWPWIFYINLPVGAIACVMTLLFMHDSKVRQRHRQGIDFVGIALLAVGLGSLQTLLEKGTREGWFESNLIIALSLLAVFGMVAFVLWELRIPHPVVNLRVLRHRGFTAGTVFGTALGFGLYGAMFILPVFLQSIQRLTAEQSGLALLPGSIATACMMPLVGRLVGRVVPRNLVFCGVVITVLSMYMLHLLSPDTGAQQVQTALIVRGIGMSMIFVPMTLATLAGLPPQELAEGSSLYNLARQLGGSAGIAYLSTFVNHRIDSHYAVLAEHVNRYDPVATLRLGQLQHYFMSQGFPASLANQQGLSLLRRSVVLQASVQSYGDAFLLMGLVFVALMPLLLLFEKKSPVKGKGAPPAH